MSMRAYRVTHITTYSYPEPVTSSYGRGYVTPLEMPGQRRLEHSVTVSPEPTDQSFMTDYYGNTGVYFHVTSEHTELTVTGRSLVEADAPEEGYLRSGLADAPWEMCRPAGRDGARAVDFLLDNDPPEITAEVREYAASILAPGRPLAEAVWDLTHRIFTEFHYKSGSTTVSTKVAEVMERRSGVCQDFARVAIACLRSHGLAASYVSGYLATTPPPGKERMIGADATHAWAAVWLPGDRWLAFDPTNDQFVDERYVTVARGRDFTDVSPLRGIIFTKAKKSSMSVSVDVAPVESPREAERADDVPRPG
ncbi:transglutaminase family protein [Hoyosella sp. G463]|uniref:Transglutaminase family protein n=1 Tax=Lolliginicoccus lacisalsi TaxID=2742202 RepID=A0A927JA37_9ACTN|nr:transglutaminase family protein [Lolliginicoccus lacisalsi]MBD8505306.1 transglutaminase family protein [Lolliginicoccus lacisalsi]